LDVVCYAGRGFCDGAIPFQSSSTERGVSEYNLETLGKRKICHFRYMMAVVEFLVKVENTNFEVSLSFPNIFTAVQTLQERPVSVENHHLVSNQVLDTNTVKNQN